MRTIEHPFWEECPECGRTNIRTFESGLKQCLSCWHESDIDAHWATWAEGPGIEDDMSVFNRVEKMKNYFLATRCTACGATDEALKQVGYTEKGRGIPAQFCKECRRPVCVSYLRTVFQICPQDQTHIAKQLEEARNEEARRRRETEREKASKLVARKRPIVGQTSKTAKKRRKK